MRLQRVVVKRPLFPAASVVASGDIASMLSEIAPGFKPNIWSDERVAFSPKDSIPTARRRFTIASSDGKCTFGEGPNTARRGTAAMALSPFDPVDLEARPRRGVDQTA